MNKFPKLVSKKWKRYNKIEKVFIIYLLWLLVLEFFLPFLKIEGVSYSFINSKFLWTDVILVFTLLFITARNVSFTVKEFVKSVFNFYENEALVNFGVLFLHASLLIYTKDLISLLAYSQSATFYQLDWGFYVLGSLLVFGLVWNLFLAVNNSLVSKKKSNYSKIVGIVEEEQEKQEVKSLFE